MAGYAREYAMSPQASGAQALLHGAKEKRRCMMPTRKKRTAWPRKSAAKSHAAGLMRVKNANGTRFVAVPTGKA